MTEHQKKGWYMQNISAHQLAGVHSEDIFLFALRKLASKYLYTVHLRVDGTCTSAQLNIPYPSKPLIPLFAHELQAMSNKFHCLGLGQTSITLCIDQTSIQLNKYGHIICNQVAYHPLKVPFRSNSLIPLFANELKAMSNKFHCLGQGQTSITLLMDQSGIRFNKYHHTPHNQVVYQPHKVPFFSKSLIPLFTHKLNARSNKYHLMHRSNKYLVEQVSPYQKYNLFFSLTVYYTFR